MVREVGLTKVLIYKQRTKEGNVYGRLPLSPNPWVDAEFLRDATVYQGITGMGVGVFALCYPIEQERPLIFLMDTGNLFSYESRQGGERTVTRILYSMFNGIIATFTEAKPEPTDQGVKLESEVNDEEGGVRARLVIEVKARTWKDGEKVPIKIYLNIEKGKDKITLEREGAAYWDEKDLSFRLDNTYVAFSEEVFRD